MKFLPLVILVFAVSTGAFADPKEYYHSRMLKNSERGFSKALSTTQEDVFEQKLDHFDAAMEQTFKQRYFYDASRAAGPAAPVLYYFCGESACDDPFRGAITAHAGKLGAHLIALEHRYYGKSYPFRELTAQNLKWLTTKQSLEDFAAFQKHAARKFRLTGKWIVVGGSYPGSLAAYYRNKYPELAAGALASSGPVQARENFEEYDLHVATVAGPVCGARMKEVVAVIEQAIDSAGTDPARLEGIKQMFAAGKIRDQVDFLYLVADVGAGAVQYGMRDDFCDKLEKAERPLDAYAKYALKLYEMWGVDAVGFSMQSAENADAASVDGGLGMRQWIWQSCTEYGYWQNAWHDAAVTVRSTRVNLDYHRGLCRRLFGLENPADAAGLNAGFYAPLLDPLKTSNVYYTNGSRDPWSRLSVSPENHNDVNPRTRTLVVEGAAHCDDLRSAGAGDSEPLRKSRALFLEQAAQWLE
ncbi:MAG: hypothetical protein A2583_11465 [Bdellovibrionales bacterium RIFOXYD1_FULL_53_11]|nr:MAG: hypothetical protein A2583_11465 [Bdellovibrionales bacterium RIFOXYD1_FULL_53_11]